MHVLSFSISSCAISPSVARDVSFSSLHVHVAIADVVVRLGRPSAHHTRVRSIPLSSISVWWDGGGRLATNRVQSTTTTTHRQVRSNVWKERIGNT